MLSVTQKTLLFGRIPTSIAGYTVNKRLRDRFVAPSLYPTIELKFVSEGIKKGWSTSGPVAMIRNPITQEWDSYYGEQDQANLSVTVWSEDQDELREITDILEAYIKIGRLDLYWPTHHMKVTGVKAVTILEPYADEMYQEHTWRAVIDFTVEYLWAWVDLDPAIRAYQYLFELGTTKDHKTFGPICSFMEGSYGMSIHIQGWRSEYLASFLALKTEDNELVASIKIVGP